MLTAITRYARTGQGVKPSGVPAWAGITDSSSHPPPSTGAYAYNTFNATATNTPIALGATYTEPVFSTTVMRITADGNGQGDGNWYVKNGYQSANGTYCRHENGVAGEIDIINTSTGAVVRSAVSGDTMCSFDPIDDDTFWILHAGTATLTKMTVSNGSTVTQHTFPAGLQNDGGTVDNISVNGEYFCILYSGSSHVYKKSTDEIYTGAPALTVSAGWCGITPDGSMLVHNESGQVNTYAINHSTKALATTAVLNWNIQGDDHGDLLSCSDGFNYLCAKEPNYNNAIFSVKLGVDRSGMTDAQMIADSNILYTIGFGTGFKNIMDDGHFSGVPTGTYQDWCVVSTIGLDDVFNSTTAWAAVKSEIFMVNVLTGALKRLAHHRSRTADGFYYREPRAGISTNGLQIIFVSNYNGSGLAANYSDLWKITP